MAKLTKRKKDCYCHACNKEFHHLGISSHRAMHRNKKENCRITFSHGNTRSWNYAEGNGCIRCNDNGCPACDDTKGSVYNPEPY